MNGITIIVALLVIALTLGAVLLARYARAWAEEQAREQRYADEWVRRHRAAGDTFIPRQGGK